MGIAMVIEYTTKFMGHTATLIFDVLLESTTTNLYDCEHTINIDAVHVAIDGRRPSHMLTGAAFATLANDYNDRLLEDAINIASEAYWTEKWTEG